MLPYPRTEVNVHATSCHLSCVEEEEKEDHGEDEEEEEEEEEEEKEAETLTAEEETDHLMIICRLTYSKNILD